jgi:hypothetical protein
MRKYKSENHLSMSAAIDTMSVTAPASLLPLFTLTEADLLACSGAKSIEYR